jgi:NAD+ synthase
MEINSSTKKDLANRIVKWIKDYATHNDMSLVVGVSGGVDSGLVSTLCCMTELPTILVSMPIRQQPDQLSRAQSHMNFLTEKYENAIQVHIDLSKAFTEFENLMISHPLSLNSSLGMANSRSRMRMMTLYQVASCFKGLVVGTGNKVEDFGVGFYTKYGDGGVDISPIADLTKTQVRELARELGLLEEISEAVPTDGLWEDNRNDEEQIGASYEELEWAMDFLSNNYSAESLSERQREVISIYEHFNSKNSHKMRPVPVFKLKNLD